MYIPGRPEQYYPQGTDWSRFRFECFLAVDAYASILGCDRRLSHPAGRWLELRAARILEMQSRHPDGHLYAKGEFDRYQGSEQCALWMISDVYLLQWLVDRQALAKKENWLRKR